jgi:hypothetical protein
MTFIDASLLQRAAADAAGAQQYPAGALYVVATPIGNLADLSLRAIHVLGLVDAVACEDTRHSAPLLRHLGLAKPLVAVHEHNERDAAAAVLARLARGERVAYVSDAGTPALSDPALRSSPRHAAGHRVLPIPPERSAGRIERGWHAGRRSLAGFADQGRERAQAWRCFRADVTAVRGPPHPSLCHAIAAAAVAQRHAVPRVGQAVRCRRAGG